MAFLPFVTDVKDRGVSKLLGIGCLSTVSMRTHKYKRRYRMFEYKIDWNT